MYFSCLDLDPRPYSRGVQQWLSNPYRIHQRLSLAFDEKPGRILFRLERPNTPRLLVLSPCAPDWARAFSDFAIVLAGEPRFKPFEPVLSRGQKLRFLLRANPTVKREGRRHGLFREEDQLKWFARKGNTGGFAPLSVRTHGGQTQIAFKGPQSKLGPQRHFAVDFEGILRVENTGDFTHALTHGVGSAKAYGFGLMTIAPA
jgi:CRISPR system Cascade subunit CasE